MVVAADVLQRIAEVLAAGKVLLESGKTAAERVAPRVDDAGVGQDQLDQADVREVVRHLVDEHRPVGLALDAGLGQKTLAQFQALRRRQRGQHGRVAHRVRRAGSQLAGKVHDVGQFGRALHRRMTRQDLLQKRGTGTRQADDEDRVARRRTETGPFAEEFRAEGLPGARHARRGLVGVVGDHAATQAVALGIVLEGFLVLRGVLQGLAQRKLQVETVLRRQGVAAQLGAHRLDLARVEAEGLEVGEAPVGLAEAAFQRDRTAVGPDPVVEPAGGLQGVAVAHPQPRLVRVGCEDGLVDRQRRGVFAERPEDRRLEVLVSGVARFGAQQHVDLLQGRGAAILPMQYMGVVVAGGIEARRQLQAHHQQPIGLEVALQAPRHFGQHAQAGDVGGLAIQMSAQQRLGARHIVVAERRRRFHELRILCRGAQVLIERAAGAGTVAAGAQMIGQRQPRRAQRRLEAHRFAQRRDCRLALPGRGARQPEFIVSQRGARFGARQGLEYRQCASGIATRAFRRAQIEQRDRVTRRHLEDLAALFLGEFRIAFQQARGVRQGHFQRTAAGSAGAHGR